jgi:hypothetical protein
METKKQCKVTVQRLNPTPMTKSRMEEEVPGKSSTMLVEPQ